MDMMALNDLRDMNDTCHIGRIRSTVASRRVVHSSGFARHTTVLTIHAIQINNSRLLDMVKLFPLSDWPPQGLIKLSAQNVLIVRQLFNCRLFVPPKSFNNFRCTAVCPISATAQNSFSGVFPLSFSLLAIALW
ncbi:hypothetical protein AJ78_05088 [Emergomyces pasteurianus Ep9510]|uniref:Uncharacterized protein n=1 Tax=Emergomyces pasteurianus Ep9510 TaxID=1447872 RepID=A0A1J9PF15_9EURO|nr:hypothetical protein AJ78_05088 [Emergomyces pasteurianus Ep9510]